MRDVERERELPSKFNYSLRESGYLRKLLVSVNNLKNFGTISWMELVGRSLALPKSGNMPPVMRKYREKW